MPVSAGDTRRSSPLWYRTSLVSHSAHGDNLPSLTHTLEKTDFEWSHSVFCLHDPGSSLCVCVHLAIRFCWQDLPSRQQIVTIFSQVWSTHQRVYPVKWCSSCGTSVSYQVTDIMRNTENCQGQCNGYIIEFIFRMIHQGCCVVRWLTTWGCDCPRPLLLLSCPRRCCDFSSLWLQPETNCIRGHIKSQKPVVWAKCKWMFLQRAVFSRSPQLEPLLPGFYYEGVCHIGNCVWNSLGDFKWKRTCCAVTRQLSFDISWNGHVCESLICKHVFLWW